MEKMSEEKLAEQLASCDLLFYTILIARTMNIESKKILKEIRKLSLKCGLEMNEEEITEILKEPYEETVEHLKTRIMKALNI